MNQRIKELALKAEVKWQHQEDVIYSTMTLEQFEKFAELIVRECIETMKRTLDTECINENEKYGCMYAIVDVKEHFGLVEDGDVTIKLV